MMLFKLLYLFVDTTTLYLMPSKAVKRTNQHGQEMMHKWLYALPVCPQDLPVPTAVNKATTFLGMMCLRDAIGI
jgi:hypothetical protein